MATTTAQSIQGFYQNILRRIGSAADVTFWANTVDVQGVPLSQVQNTFVTSPEAMTNVLPIVEIYQTYLGRAPDSAGLTAWVKAFEAGTSLSAIQSAFANSAESAKFYGGSISTPANAAFVTQLYQTVLNRGPTSAEVTGILAVTTDRATLLADFMASPEAQVTLTNASNQFLNTIGSGNTDVYGAPLFNSGVIASNVFTLTPGADTIPGGSLVGSNGTSNNGNVLIQGSVDTTTPANTTLSAADNLNGGTGANTLSVTYAGGAAVSAPNGALISNVQTFNMRNTGTGIVTLDASQIAGLTNANSNLGTGSIVVGNLATGAAAGIIGNGTVQNGSLEFGYKTATDAATLNLSGGVSQGAALNVTVDGSPATLQINSTGAANKINNVVNGTNSIKTVNVNAAANFTTTGFVDTALATITLSGAATAVDLGTENSAAGTLKSVDASALTGGGVKVNVGANNTNAAFTFTGGGGGGNTLILPATELAALTSGAQLNGGSAAGNTLATADVLIDGSTPAAVAAAAAISASTNFQTLEFVGASATLDQSQITNTAFTKAQFGLSGAGAVKVSSATTATQYSIAQTAAGTGAVTLGALLGQNTLNLSLDGTSTASVTAASITETNAGTLNLASNGSFATTPNTIGTTVTLPDNGTLKVTGPEALTITGAVLAAAPATAGEIVDASTFMGKLTVNEAAGNSKAVFMTGTGGSAITAQDTGAAQINNFTLGTGADKLSFLAGSSQIGSAGIGTTGTVTGFAASNDTFALGGAPVTTLASASAAGTGVLLTDLMAALPAGVAAGKADLVTITGAATDSGSWLVRQTAGALVASTDTAIHLVGLTGTLGTSNFV